MDSYMTNSMKFKTGELLKDVSLEYSAANAKVVDEVVSSIKEAIDSIPDDFQVTGDIAPGFVRDIKADKVEFKFRRPTCIEIAGSYSMQCVVRPDVNIDLFLRLPKECFHEKDYLNYRYHAKRFLYLCVIKKHLKASLDYDIRWSTFQNEARKPTLVVSPASRLPGNVGFVVKIIPTATSLFSVTKLNMSRNNVRSLNQGGTPQATPRYNSSILEDMFLEDNAGFIRKIFLGWKELGDALMLLKVWARQRSSIYVHDCLNGFLLSVIMAYLAKESNNSRVNKSMDAMQIFRVILHFIANSKLWATGMSFYQQVGSNNPNKEKGNNIHLFPVIIFDAFAKFNYCFRLSKNGLQEMQNEAAMTLTCMEKCRDGGFDEIFMTRMDFPAKYDYCIRLNLKGSADFFRSGFCLDDECWRSYEHKVLSLMEQGLQGRAKSVRVIWRNTDGDINLEEGLNMFGKEALLIGVSTNLVEESLKLVTMGPSPEEKDEALKFRKFWGDKATLRQFRDTRIAEVVVWEHSDWSRHLIIKEITEWVLSRHLVLSKEQIVPIVDQLDFSLQCGKEDPMAFSKSLLKAFDDLSKRLCLLDDIPLRVSSVQPLDAAFRLTSVFPPGPHPLAQENHLDIRPEKLLSTCLEPLEVLLQLEGSGNWPLDDIALEKTKAAFLLKIGESLQKNWGMECSATEDNVDIFMSGFAFRLKILHERALYLTRNSGGENHVKRILASDRELFLHSQHASMINGLWGRYPTYGPVVRLAKRWVSAHLLSPLLAEEATELLVAHLFLRPFPFTPPFSRITGFLRFLRLLSEYDWAFSPLVIDINADFTPEDEKEINDKFMLSRKTGEENPQMLMPAMFLATTYDKFSEAWTTSSPSAAGLKRLAAYATISANVLTKLILEDQLNSYPWECLFRTPLNNYDAIVLFHRDKLPYPRRLLFASEVDQGRLIARGRPTQVFSPFILPVNGKHVKASVEELKNKLMVDFDPVRCFIDEIEAGFPGMFKVWFDSLGSDAIGLTWGKANPKKRGRVSVDEDNEELIDVLKAVGLAGKGFVRSVHLLKSPKLISS